MLVPFGFSVGDCITGLGFAYSICNALAKVHGVSSEYTTLCDSINSYLATLETLQSIQTTGWAETDRRTIIGRAINDRATAITEKVQEFKLQTARFDPQLSASAKSSCLKRAYGRFTWAARFRKKIPQFWKAIEPLGSQLQFHFQILQVELQQEGLKRVDGVTDLVTVSATETRDTVTNTAQYLLSSISDSSQDALKTSEKGLQHIDSRVHDLSKDMRMLVAKPLTSGLESLRLSNLEENQRTLGAVQAEAKLVRSAIKAEGSCMRQALVDVNDDLVRQIRRTDTLHDEFNSNLRDLDKLLARSKDLARVQGRAMGVPRRSTWTPKITRHTPEAYRREFALKQEPGHRPFVPRLDKELSDLPRRTTLAMVAGSHHDESPKKMEPRASRRLGHHTSQLDPEHETRARIQAAEKWQKPRHFLKTVSAFLQVSPDKQGIEAVAAVTNTTSGLNRLFEVMALTHESKEEPAGSEEHAETDQKIDETRTLTSIMWEAIHTFFTYLSIYYTLKRFLQSVARSPRLLLDAADSIHLSDAFNRSYPLQFHVVCNWKVFWAFLECQMQNTPAKYRLIDGRFKLLLANDYSDVLGPHNWTDKVKAGSQVVMSVAMSIPDEAESCYRPDCYGRLRTEGSQKLKCTQCNSEVMKNAALSRYQRRLQDEAELRPNLTASKVLGLPSKKRTVIPGEKRRTQKGRPVGLSGTTMESPTDRGTSDQSGALTVALTQDGLERLNQQTARTQSDLRRRYVKEQEALEDRRKFLAEERGAFRRVYNDVTDGPTSIATRWHETTAEVMLFGVGGWISTIPSGYTVIDGDGNDLDGYLIATPDVVHETSWADPSAEIRRRLYPFEDMEKPYCYDMQGWKPWDAVPSLAASISTASRDDPDWDTEWTSA